METVHLLRKAVVTAESSHLGLDRIGGSNHLASGGNNIVALPDHCHDGPSRDPCAKRLEKGLALMFSIMLFKVSLVRSTHFHGDELKSASFQPGDHLVNKSSLHGFWLQHEESSFSDVLSRSLLCLDHFNVF